MRELKVSEWRNELVATTMQKIEAPNAIHVEVTIHHTPSDQHVICFTLRGEKMEVFVKPPSFIKGWALIELYDETIDWSIFKGNKVYIGISVSISWSLSCLYVLLS